MQKVIYQSPIESVVFGSINVFSSQTNKLYSPNMITLYEATFTIYLASYVPLVCFCEIFVRFTPQNIQQGAIWHEFHDDGKRFWETHAVDLQDIAVV